MDKQKIYLSLQALQSSDQKLREEALSYLDQIEQEKELIFVVFQVFEQAQEHSMKLASLLYIVELCKSLKKFVKKGRISLRKILDDNQKTLLRTKLVSLLKSTFHNILRINIEEAMMCCALSDLPETFSELFEYIMEVISSITTTIAQSDFKPDEQTLQALSTIGVTFKTLARDRTSLLQNEMYLKIAESFLPPFIKVWQHLMPSCNSGNLLAAKYSLVLDTIFVNFIRNARRETLGHQVISECIQQIFEKAKLMTEYAKKLQSDQHLDLELMEIVEQNLTVLLFDYIKIMRIQPLHFEKIFPQYLVFSHQVLNIDWKTPMAPKLAMLILLEHLKSIYFVTDPNSMSAVSKKSIGDIDPNIITQCFLHMQDFFINQGNLLAILERILQYSMLIREETDEELDSVLTEDSPGKLAILNSELDTTARQIGLCLIDKLVYVYPNESVPLIASLISKIVNSKGEGMTIGVQDNILSILIRLPEALKIEGDSNIQIIEIAPILEFIYSAGASQPILLRRLPLIAREWLSFLSIEQKRAIMGILMSLIEAEDLATQYNAILCLDAFIRNNDLRDVNYSMILEKSVPAVLRVSAQLNDASLRYMTVRFIKHIIMHLVKIEEFDACEHLSNLDLDIIFQKRFDPMVGSLLIEIIKHIIVTLPYGTYIEGLYRYSLRFIQLYFPNLSEEDDSFLNFWVFIIKEIPVSQESIPLIKEYIQTLNQCLPKLSKIADFSQINLLTKLVTQYILLDVELVFDPLEFLSFRESYMKSLPDFEEQLEGFSFILKAYNVIFLKATSSVEQSMLLSALNLAANVIDSQQKVLTQEYKYSIETLSLELFGRYMIQHPQLCAEVIKAYPNFIENWVMMTECITAQRVLKINTLAYLGALQHLPLEQLCPCFEKIMAVVVREVYNEVDGIVKKGKKGMPNRMEGYCNKMFILAETNSYAEFTLLNTFKSSVNVFSERLTSSHLSLPNFSDTILEENFKKLLQLGGN